MGHGHQAHTQVAVGVHRHAHSQHAGQVRELLHVAHAAPVVRIAQHDLHRVQFLRARHVGETSGRDVAGLRRAVALGQQAPPHFGHSFQGRARVLEISTAG